MRTHASHFRMFGERRKRMQKSRTALLYRQVANSDCARAAKDALSFAPAKACTITRYSNCDFRTEQCACCTALLYAWNRRLTNACSCTIPSPAKHAVQMGGVRNWRKSASQHIAAGINRLVAENFL